MSFLITSMCEEQLTFVFGIVPVRAYLISVCACSCGSLVSVQPWGYEVAWRTAMPSVGFVHCLWVRLQLETSPSFCIIHRLCKPNELGFMAHAVLKWSDSQQGLYRGHKVSDAASCALPTNCWKLVFCFRLLNITVTWTPLILCSLHNT
jgi:hypothetical protein